MRNRVRRHSFKKARQTLALFGYLSIGAAIVMRGIDLEGRLSWIYGGLGLVLLVLFGLLEWRHRQYRARPSSRAGAALILALAAVALVAALLAVGGARAQGVKADQTRADYQARLRAALWDAAWSRLENASSAPDGIPAPVQREAPDGVKTAVTVQKLAAERRGEPVRFSLSVMAQFEKDRREAWGLVQRSQAGDYRILTWVER